MEEYIKEDTSLAGTKIQAVPKEPVEVGIDTDSKLTTALIAAADQSVIDSSALDNFLNISQSREQIYSLIDTMSQDSTIAAIIETYVEDICEPNDRGEILWCESAKPEITAYIQYLLNSLNIEKNARNWVTKLVKYGDLYLKLYHKSDYDNDLVFGTTDVFTTEEEIKDKKVLTETLWKDDVDKLKEDINISYHSPQDHYVHYVEAEPNPAELFELMKFGKTAGFIVAPTNILNTYKQDTDYLYNPWYKLKRTDVTVYQATDFVHIVHDDNSSRTPEEVDLFLTDDDYDTEENAQSYRVRRGQSLLYNVFKVWRVLSLLENSIALNRINKTSLLRILEIECGNMSEKGIQNTLSNIKEMVEQKTAIKKNDNMAEYINPGPVENTIYLATNGAIGKINTTELGSTDSDPRSLIDLDYYNNKLFGALRVPKQYFALTDDGAGFNGGESLALISSRYGKAIKGYQNDFIQGITDLINLFLIDKGLDSYINEFTLKMQSPVTKELMDRREQANNEIGIVRDLMDIIASNVDDKELQLKALNVLLASSSQDSDLIAIVNEQISKLKSEGEEPEEPEEEKEEPEEGPGLGGGNMSRPAPLDLDNLPSEEEETETTEVIAPEESEEELPTFQELGIEDATDLEA